MREMLREASIPVSGVWRTQIPGVDPGLSAISAAVPSHPEIMRDAVCAVHEGFGLA
jgi:hypothetical protein